MVVDDQKDPWGLPAQFPKASQISDAYLGECENLVRDHCKEMMKPLGAVPAGLVSVIAGVLVGAGFPYWFQGKSLQLGVNGAVFGVAAIIGLFLCFWLEFLRFLPGDYPSTAGQSIARLKAFWKAVGDRHDQQEDDQLCDELRVFIRHDRERTAEALRTLAAGRHRNLWIATVSQALGLLILTIFTAQLLSKAHEVPGLTGPHTESRVEGNRPS
ncbi:hypothetical protein [Acetobacter sicerae]|uniref:hypothetical protein n=1 Tax=Acetobacter sicerae TaxID=85325 RepID=UPI00156B191E|nr:hypothetical protein [Acetobacter sicerae]NHN93477.1 hypothetical protein [Acetobacter sicerae]